MQSLTLCCNKRSKADDVWAAWRCTFVADEKDENFCSKKCEGKFLTNLENPFVPILTQMFYVDLNVIIEEVLKKLWVSKADAVVLGDFLISF